MNYRVAEQKDLPALEELALASYGRLKKSYAGKLDKDGNAPEIRSDFSVLVRDCHSFVFEENGRLLGMAWLVPSRESDESLFCRNQLYTHGGRASRCRR